MFRSSLLLHSFLRAVRHPATALALGALALAPCLHAQDTGTISGRVLNQATGEYLRNAVVSVPDTALTTTSGPGGFYRLPGVPAGTARVSVFYTGLDPAEATLTVAAGQVVNHDFALSGRGYDGALIELGEFTVAATREGNARAIMEQRASLNARKVIAADAIGNVSEGNVGEFLKLMPGVSMDYVEADTRSMRVRGLNPKYANVLLDGMMVASAGSSNVGTGRAFEFEQLSIASVETVELTKNPTPDQPSSVAGTVNLRTKGAFDREGRRINYSAALAGNSYYMSLSRTPGWDDERRRKILPNFSLEYSDVFNDGKLGLIAGLSHNSTIAAQKHIWFWMDAFDNDASNNATEVPRINWIWLQDGPKPTDRNNYMVRLDYRAGDEFHLYGRIGFNTYDARFYNRTLSLRPDRDGTGALLYAPGATKTDMTVTSGRISTDSNQFMTKEGDTLSLSGGGTWTRGDFSIDFGGSYTRQKNWYDNLTYGHFTDFSSSINNVGWRLTRPGPGSTDITLTQTAGPDWRNIANYTFDANSIGWHERRSQDAQSTLRVDFKHLLRAGETTHTLKYGLMTTDRQYEVHRYGLLRTDPVGPDGVRGTADDPRPVDFVDPHFRAKWSFTANMNDWPALSPWLIHDFYRANPSHFIDATAANTLNRTVNNWWFDEQIHAAYVQDVVKIGRLEIAPGLRYEYTDSSGRGFDRVTVAPITGGNTYDSILYYLHSNYRLNDDLTLRGSFHTAVTRADIVNLIPGISGVNDTDRILTASNPDLKEERSQILDIGLDYYFEPVGSLSVSIFTARVQDRQASGRVTLGPGGYEGDTSYAGWDLVTTTNVGASTRYCGFELDYSQQLEFLPGPLKGLGIFANHTRLNYDDWAFYLGSPKEITNAGLAYSHGRFGGRINANWVGKILTVASATAPEYQKDRLACDLNLEFKLSRRFVLFLDGRNIFNEPSQYTYRAREENFIRVLNTGSIWIAGVKGAF